MLFFQEKLDINLYINMAISLEELKAHIDQKLEEMTSRTFTAVKNRVTLKSKGNQSQMDHTLTALKPRRRRNIT